MTTNQSCRKCGANLNGASTEGLCPACLLEGGLRESAPDAAIGEEWATRLTADSSRPALAGADTHHHPAVGRNFGDYELIEEIARGGMGVVYKARQISLDRTVAIKMILGGPLASKEFIHRFRTEAAAAANLQHPNIVAVHEVGAHEGENFLAMDFVDGPNLTHLVGQQPLPAQRAARYLKAVAEAIHYAHERSILHRDLKPSNILVGSDDQPRVTDFGLAKRLEAESELTLSGQVLGSPNYMSPEQASGKRGQVGKRSDVYSLGAVLYHLLTARPPFQAGSLTDTLHEVMNTEPVSPRLLNPSVPLDLETICLKCLEKEPEKRYQTAKGLAAELNRFLNDETILARPVTRAERAWRWCRRKPALAGSLLAILILILIVSIGSPIAAFRINQARTSEATQRQKAEAAAIELRRKAYAAEINVAFQALAENNLERARQLLDRQRPNPGEEDLRGFEWRHLWSLCQDKANKTFSDANGDRVAYSPDGQLLAYTAGKQRYPLDTVIVRHAVSHDLVATLSASAETLSFSSRTNLLATSDHRGVKFWDTRTWRAVDVALPGAVYPAKFSPDGRWLIARTANGFQLWNADTWQLAGSCPLAPLDTWPMPMQLAFSPDSRFVITPDGDQTQKRTSVKVRTVPELKAVPGFEFGAGYVCTTAFTADGKCLLVGYGNGTIPVWDFEKRAIIDKLPGHTAGVYGIVASPDGKLLATAGADHVINLWDAPTRRHLATLRGHVNGVIALAFSPDSQTLASISPVAPPQVKLWDTRLRDHREKIEGAGVVAGFSADSEILFTASEDVLKRWNVASNTVEEARVTMPGPSEEHAHWVAITGEAPIMALGKPNGELEVLNLATESLQRRWRAHSTNAQAVAFSPDGKRVATSTTGGEVKIWETATGKELAHLGPFENTVYCVAFSPDGKTLAASIFGWGVALWNISERRALAPLEPRAGFGDTVAFAPDGKFLAATSNDNVRLWELPSGKLRATLKGHIAMTSALAFSPDGKTLVTGAGDGKVKFWHLTTLQELVTFNFENSCRTLKFSPDGRTLAGGFQDGTAQWTRVWRAPSLEEIDAAEQGQQKASSKRN